MNTSSKLKKLQRIRRLKRQRHIALMCSIVMMIAFVNLFIVRKTFAEKECATVSVTVKSGDTLWDIAKRHKPEGTDTRKFVREISQMNGIENATIVCGQKIYIPSV